MKTLTPANGLSVSDVVSEFGTLAQTQLESQVRTSFKKTALHPLRSDLSRAIFLHPKRGSCVLAYVLSVKPTRSALLSSLSTKE
jgi:hypothetical protein